MLPLTDPSVTLYAMPAGVFLDTNIYLNWACGRKRALLRKLARCRVPIHLAPTVIVEAIEDFWFASEHEITEHRRALKLMSSWGARRILQPYYTFVPAHLGTTQKPLGRNLWPRQLRRWIRFAIGLPVAFHATARDGGITFNKVGFGKSVDSFRNSYIDMLNEVRRAMLNAAGLPLSADKLDSVSLRTVRRYLKTTDWKETYFKRITPHMPSHLAGAEAAEVCSLRLSAAFEFDTAILDLVLATGYKPENHRGDVFDHTLLMYLADPDLTLITADAKMKLRLSDSPQRHRIIVV
jgi:hypothetical protein